MNRLYTHHFYLLFLATALLLTGQSLADGVMRDGLGAISGGRGGTNLGHFDNGAIVHDNPAGMVNLRGSGLNEFSVDALLADLDYIEADNGHISADRKPYVLPYLSMIRKSEDGLWAYGLGIFAPAGFGAEYEMMSPNINPGDPSKEYEYKSFAALAKVLPSLSVRLTDRLSVGGSLGVAVSHAELEAPFYGQSGGLANVPTVMDLQGTGAALCWSLGLQYALTDSTTLGVCYTSESRFDLDGSAHVEVAGLGQSRYDLEMGLTWPQSLGGGIRHQWNKRHIVSADVIWYDWSQAFDSLDLEFSDPSNPVFENLLGPTVSDALPLSWRDTTSVRLGYEYAWLPCSVLRTGYIYHRNPVPASTLTPFIPATLEHAITSGYGHRWRDRRFDIGYQFSFGSSQDVGTSDVVGGDFDNSNMDAAAHWLFLSYQQAF